MYRKILVGYAADRHVEGALSLAHLLATNGSVEEVLVLEVRKDAGFAGSAPPIPRDAHGNRLTAESNWPDGTKVTHRLASGRSPAETLSAIADEEGADILVLGATHRHALGRLVFGTTAGTLLPGAKWPVVVAPDGYSKAPASLGTIAAAIDGSEQSAAALSWAVALAKAFDAKLRLLTVVESPPPVETWGADVPAETWAAGLSPEQTDRVTAAVKERVRPELTAAESALGEGNAEVVTIVGDAQHELRNAAEDVDTLVVGSHGSGRSPAAVLGSVSQGLARSCPAPLAVVPAGS
jgi:nucleotide-binding universal stress UspA family protein